MPIVAFRVPVDATARELRQWMDKKPKGSWSTSCSLMGQTHRLVAGQVSWQKREVFWQLLIQMSSNFPKMSFQVDFAEANDAMLFKLTWG